SAPGTPSSDPRVELRALLDKRAEAVLDGDRAAFLATVDKNQKGYHKRQGTLFSAMRTVPFSAFTYEITRLETPLSPPRGYKDNEAYQAQVETRYKFEGQDNSPVLARDSFTFVETRSGWRIAGPGDAGMRRRDDHEIWEDGPVRTARSARTLIVFHKGQGELAGRLLRAADRAYAQVGAAWTGKWERKAVILVPRNETEAERLVGARDLSRVAAVASSSVESGGVEGVLGNRIVVNSSNVVRYDPLNLQVLVTHEMTHVATRTLGDGVPLLLVEGFADYTALKPVRAPFEITHQALARRSFDGRLPANKDFRTSNAPVAYDEGSAFCQWVAATYGSRKLQALYREFEGSDSTSGPEFDRGVRRILGISRQTAERRWAAWVREQLAN
ncbi:MAG TPA: hypothetical protein VFS70_19090, partial [Actinomycetota bacterium]|nr:hypothetical protein [Actinomycetota bacterium]